MIRTIAAPCVLAGFMLVCSSCAPSAPATGYEHLNTEINEQLKAVGLGPGDTFEVRIYCEDKLIKLKRANDFISNGIVHLQDPPYTKRIQRGCFTTFANVIHRVHPIRGITFKLILLLIII